MDIEPLSILEKMDNQLFLICTFIFLDVKMTWPPG